MVRLGFVSFQPSLQSQLATSLLAFCQFQVLSQPATSLLVSSKLLFLSWLASCMIPPVAIPRSRLSPGPQSAVWLTLAPGFQSTAWSTLQQLLLLNDRGPLYLLNCSSHLYLLSFSSPLFLLSCSISLFLCCSSLLFFCCINLLTLLLSVPELPKSSVPVQ